MKSRRSMGVFLSRLKAVGLRRFDWNEFVPVSGNINRRRGIGRGADDSVVGALGGFLSFHLMSDRQPQQT